MEDAITIEEAGGRGRYVLPLSGGAHAELTFQRQRPHHMLITHTSVPRDFEGQGIGARLVERAVADARSGGYKITPLCGYVAAQIRRHPDWQDVLQR